MKIDKITEAFSMQPKQHYIGEVLYFSDPKISAVLTEMREEPNDVGTMVIFGYSHNNEILFQYLANTVNIEYRPEDSTPIM